MNQPEPFVADSGIAGPYPLNKYEISTGGDTAVKTIPSGGASPSGIAFEWANVWISNFNSNNV
jgi:hypothetical protein